MGLSFTEFIILGFLGACLFIGPKKLIPRISETFRVTKQIINEESTKSGLEPAAKNGQEKRTTAIPADSADKHKQEEKKE